MREVNERERLADTPPFREMVVKVMKEYRAGKAISEAEFWAQILGDTHEENWQQEEHINDALATQPTPDEEESLKIGLSHARRLARDEDDRFE